MSQGDQPNEIARQFEGRILNGRYLLLLPLSKGPLSWMFKAADLTLHRDVAVKLLRPQILTDADFLNRFKKELQKAAQLNHTHIADVYDWNIDETPYLVTELCRGGNLRGMLDEIRAGESVPQSIVEQISDVSMGGALTHSQVISIGIQAAEALSHAHSKGQYHLDISPSNILFDLDGRVKLSDFGIAQMFTQKAPPAISESLLGSSYYSAPEQLMDTGVLDGRTDVYGLAMVLIEAAVGIFPFRGDTSIGTYLKRINEPLELPPGMGDLGKILSLGVNLDPQKRITAAELIWYLKGLEEYKSRVPIPIKSTPDLRHITKLDWSQFEKFQKPAEQQHAEKGEHQAEKQQVEKQVLVGEYNTASIQKRHGRRKAEGRRRARASIFAAVIIVLLAGAVTANSIASWAWAADPPKVPDVVGSSADTIEELAATWDIRQYQLRDHDYLPGQIISVDPPAGTPLEKDSLLTVTVSLGEPLRTLTPGLLRIGIEDAELRLSGIGLSLGDLFMPQDGGYVSITKQQATNQGFIVLDFNEPTTEFPLGAEVSLLVGEP